MKNTTIFTIVLSILCLTVFIFGVVTVSKINNAYNNLLSSNNNLNSRMNQLSNEISSIESRIQQELEKQSSIIETYKINIGDLISDDLTVPVEITVTPKEYKESTQITVNIGDNPVNAERNGSTFIAKANVPALEAHDVSVSINTDGVIKNEAIKEKINVRYMVTQKAKADMQGKIVYKDNKLTFENNMMTIVYSPFKGSSISNVRLFATVEGTEVWEKDITNDFKTNKSDHSFEFSKTFDISKNKEFFMFVDITESNGLKYRLFIKGLIPQKDSFTHLEIEQRNILFDKNGNEIIVD